MASGLFTSSSSWSSYALVDKWHHRLWMTHMLLSHPTVAADRIILKLMLTRDENGVKCSTDKEPDQESVLLSKLVTSNEKKVSGNELETNNQTVLAHHFKRRDVAKYGIGLRHPSDSLVSERPLDSSIFQNWDEIPASYSAKDEGKL